MSKVDVPGKAVFQLAHVWAVAAGELWSLSCHTSTAGASSESSCAVCMYWLPHDGQKFSITPSIFLDKPEMKREFCTD